MKNFPQPFVVRPGNTGKLDPFTVLIVANPALEAPWNASAFVVDPIMSNRPCFDACVRYVNTSLFGGLQSQTETLLGDAAIAPHVRLLSLFHTGLPAVDQHSFVAQDGASNLLVARRNPIRDFLANEGLLADIVYAISASNSHDRASAWFTTDDDTGPGVPFVVDGTTLYHRHRYVVPGTIGMHCKATSMTAVHEFQHAVSSYSNGQIVDLYVDSKPALNNKSGRPIPLMFGTYGPPTFNSDLTRGGLTYPSSWRSYHCEIHDPFNPALMDNYYSAPGGIPEVCQNDKITRQFVRDRVLAKIGR